jgi:hypothetical protein
MRRGSFELTTVALGREFQKLEGECRSISSCQVKLLVYEALSY